MAPARRKSLGASSAALAVAQTDIEYLKDAVTGLKTTGDATAVAVAEMRNELTRYRGMIGGMLLLVSALVTVFGFFKGAIVAKFFTGSPKA